MTTAAKLAAYIRKAGFPVLRTSEQNDYVDAMVFVTDEVLVQIFTTPIGYCVTTQTVENDEPMWTSYELRETKKAMLNDLRRVLANA